MRGYIEVGLFLIIAGVLFGYTFGQLDRFNRDVNRMMQPYQPVVKVAKK